MPHVLWRQAKNCSLAVFTLRPRQCFCTACLAPAVWSSVLSEWPIRGFHGIPGWPEVALISGPNKSYGLRHVVRCDFTGWPHPHPSSDDEHDCLLLSKLIAGHAPAVEVERYIFVRYQSKNKEIEKIVFIIDQSFYRMGILLTTIMNSYVRNLEKGQNNFKRHQNDTVVEGARLGISRHPSWMNK